MRSDDSIRWTVGIDIGVKSNHQVTVLDRRTAERVRRDFSVARTWAGIRRLREVLSEADEVEVTLEPTGNAWRPVAGALVAAGFTVYLLPPKKASRLRKARSDHAKSDRIDAETLARAPLFDPEQLNRLRLPPTEVARLRDLVRHRQRLADGVGARKQRIQTLIGQVQPTLIEGLGEDKFLTAYRAFLRKYVDPRRIVRLGRKRLHGFLDRRHRGDFDPERTERIFAAAVSGAELLEAQEPGTLPFDVEQVQLEVSMELDLLEAEEAQIADLADRMDELYEELDPTGMMRTLPGFGPIVSAGVLGETGALARFATVGNYRGYVSYVPRYKATGQSHNPRQKIRKSGPRLLKKYFYLAADSARQCDLELAALYDRLRRKGRHHDQAVCAVANHLAGRAYAVMKRMAEGKDEPYQFRDLDGNPISKREASRRAKAEFPGPTRKKRQQEAREAENEASGEEANEEARRPSPACSRPPETDASSRTRDTPRPVSEIPADSGRADPAISTRPRRESSAS